DNYICCPFEQVFENEHLVRYFCAANDGDKWFACLVKYFFRTLHFGFHQQSKHLFIAWKEFCNYSGGRMCPMGRPKCIININISQGSQFFSESLITFFFFLVKPEVFK